MIYCWIVTSWLSDRLVDVVGVRLSQDAALALVEDAREACEGMYQYQVFKRAVER